MKLDRDVYTPQKGSGYIKIESEKSTAVVYYHPEKCCAMGWSGRAVKPQWNFIFKNYDTMFLYIDKWIDNIDKKEEYKQEQKAERKSKSQNHKFKIGSVLERMWGYDQTNINYYEVVGFAGNQTLIIREIAQERTEEGWMQGKCVPLKGHYIGPEEKKRIRGEDSIKYNSFSYAFLIIPKIINGIEIYNSSHWTGYA